MNALLVALMLHSPLIGNTVTKKRRAARLREKLRGGRRERGFIKLQTDADPGVKRLKRTGDESTVRGNFRNSLNGDA
jgi:hypothetical protein